jgi:hypothetical protein
VGTREAATFVGRLRISPRALTACVRVVPIVLVICGAFTSPAWSQSAPQQATGQNCQNISQNIATLHQAIGNLSAKMESLRIAFNGANLNVVQAQQKLQTADLPSGLLDPVSRGEFLDSLASLMQIRKGLRERLDADASQMQALHQQLASLLASLGHCGHK